MMQTEVSNEDEPSRSLAVSKRYLRKVPSRTNRTRPSPFIISQSLVEFDDYYILQVEFSSESNAEKFNYEQHAGKVFLTNNGVRKQLMVPDDVDVSLLAAGIYEGVYKFNLPKKQ